MNEEEYPKVISATTTAGGVWSVPTHLEPSSDPDAASFYSEYLKIYNEMKHVEFTPITPYGAKDWDYIESFEDLGWWIYRFWTNDVCYWWDNLRDGVSNYFDWAKLIWNDRDWDSGYLNTMLLFKLRRMQPAIRKHVMPGPHMVALDRAVIVLEEYIRRDKCDCYHLHNFCGDLNLNKPTDEKTKARLEVCRACEQTKKELMLEFSELFGKFSPSWWD